MQKNMTIEQEDGETEPTATVAIASCPTEATPKEWQQHHNQWLNATMWAVMGKENHPKILELQEKVQVLCLGPDLEIDTALAKEYVMRFNLCIKVAMGENQVEHFHQAFCKWYLKLREMLKQSYIHGLAGLGMKKAS